MSREELGYSGTNKKSRVRREHSREWKKNKKTKKEKGKGKKKINTFTLVDTNNNKRSCKTLVIQRK